MNNTTVNMNLTPQEVLIIESLRACQAVNAAVDSRKTEAQIKEELMDKYMAMDDYDFIHEYAKIIGDDTILAVLQDTLETDGKWNVIFDAIDEDAIIDDLFEAYVSEDTRRQLFLDLQDRTELCSQLVDLTING
jgi:hypothetical protein